jgi:hypothetical protein
LPINGKPYPFMGSLHWYFNPAVWRMKYIRPRWKGHKDNIHFYINSENGLLPPGKERPSPEWYTDVLGAYIWGDVGEPAFFAHRGVSHSRHKVQSRV